MKKILPLLAVAVCLAGDAAPSKASPYFHIGFNQVSGGVFFPIAGNISDQQAGFLTPAIEHDAADGYVLIKGLSYNPLNLGYVGKTSGFSDFLTGKALIGPSVQWGDLAKMGLRFACNALPNWSGPDRYSALKALLAPGQDGIYADAGIYEAFPLNQFGDIAHMKPETLVGATLNKKF